MVYTPYVWALTDAITPTRLNHMETQYDEGVAYIASHNHDTRYYTTAQYNSKYQQGNNPVGGDADTLELKHGAEVLDMIDLTGLIAFWDTATPPDGWAICDGTNGTPNLRDHFLVCSGSSTDGSGASRTFTLGTPAGIVTQTPAGSITVASHAVTWDEMATHSHGYNDAAPNSQAYITNSTGGDVVRTAASRGPLDTDSQGGSQGHTHGASITFDSYDNRPAYIALLPIMKIAEV